MTYQSVIARSVATKQSIARRRPLDCFVATLLAMTVGMFAVSASAETLKLGNEGVYPPFSILDPSGKLSGVEPDVAREMCKRMAVECELVVMEYKALIPSLLQGKLDAV